MLQHVRFKTHWIICSSTNFVTRFFLATCGVRHFRSTARAEDDGYARWPRLPPLCFTAAEKHQTYRLKLSYVRNDTETLLSLRCRDVDTIITNLSIKVSRYRKSHVPAVFTLSVCPNLCVEGFHFVRICVWCGPDVAVPQGIVGGSIEHWSHQLKCETMAFFKKVAELFEERLCELVRIYKHIRSYTTSTEQL